MLCRKEGLSISMLSAPEDVFRHDDVERADLAIVLGTSGPELVHRITAGAQLINSGRIKKLLLTGDGRKRHAAYRTEAERMREAAIKLGVSPCDIILEGESQDTIANAKKCNDILQSHPDLQNVQSIFLVSSAWHMLRSFIIMRHHLSDTITLFCHPTKDGFTKDNWESFPEGVRLVNKELHLISGLLKRGYNIP